MNQKWNNISSERGQDIHAQDPPPTPVSLTVSERTSTSHPPLYRTASEIEMVFFDYVFTKEERKRSLSYLFSLVRRAQTKYDEEEEEKGKKNKIYTVRR